MVALREIAREWNIPVQVFSLRNDERSGSTIGPHIASQLGMPTVDIGIPVVGMHSAREMARFFDWEQLEELLKRLLENHHKYR